MNAIETWNALAESWLGWIGEAAVASAVVLIVAGGAWFALRRHASAHLGHLLFLLPLVPLVLPVTGLLEFEVPADSAGAALVEFLPTAQTARPTAVDETVTTGPRRIPFKVPAATATTSTPSPAISAGPRPTALAWIALAWALVVSVLLTRFIVVQRQTQRMVERALPTRDARLDHILSRLRRRAGVGRNLRVVESSAVSSPAVWGVRRPTVILPPGLAPRLDDEQLEWVLLHELAHLRRKDLVVATAQRLVQILWFFHPLVWMTGRVVEELRECACDEAALARCPKPKRRRYAEALLEVVAGRIPEPTPRLALQTLHDETALMKKRILRLIDPRRTARRGLTLAAVPLLVAVAGVSLATVKVAEQDPGEKPKVVGSSVGDEELQDPAQDLRAARRAVDRGLAWLLDQQLEEGHWPQGPDTEEDAGEFNTIGVTGFVVLSLLEAQHVNPRDEQRDAIERALEFLERNHDPEKGIFGEVRGHRYMASHAIATLAWLRAHEGEPEQAWKPRGEEAVAFILRARNPYKGWRFGEVPMGDNDTFSTSLMLRTLSQAEGMGIEIPRQASSEPLGYLEGMTDAVGRTGYDYPGGSVSRLAGKDDFPAEYSEMCTAISIMARLDWGQEPMRSETIRRGGHVVAEQAPMWDPDRGSIDYYHWLYGTQVMARLGGYEFDHWRDYLLRALLPNQNAEGWWPAIDAWSGEGTTVHATVINTLALQHALLD